MGVTDSARTTRTTPLLDAAIEPPKARRLRLIVTVAVVTLGSSIQSGFATGVVPTTAPTHAIAPHTAPIHARRCALFDRACARGGS